ncbi:hypothetical protein Ae331Ps2_6366 [Pseudonocardia sp. Ae331_Ps2]|nr:hypothetical protein Ae331Ps2_6366 [Pseudonocardia sp. Ae331_Ps2]
MISAIRPNDTERVRRTATYKAGSTAPYAAR